MQPRWRIRLGVSVHFTRLAGTDEKEIAYEENFLAVVAVSWLVGGATAVRAQDEGAAPPPKVLVITREMVKVGKGAAHAKNEAAWVRAAMAAKEPDRYLAATTMSGTNEALFFEGFDTYAAFGEADKYDNQPKVRASDWTVWPRRMAITCPKEGQWWRRSMKNGAGNRT